MTKTTDNITVDAKQLDEIITLYMDVVRYSEYEGNDVVDRAVASKQAIWAHEDNIGSSRRFSEYIRVYDEVTIEKQSSTGTKFQHSAIRGWTDNVTIIWR